MKILKIQQKRRPGPGGMLPYPYFVYGDGRIGTQKFWKGHPLKLLGFSKEPVAGDMQIMIHQFFFNPEAVIGMYPVFEDKYGKWFTDKNAVESIERVRKGKEK
jgi:hypothetical protein